MASTRGVRRAVKAAIRVRRNDCDVAAKLYSMGLKALSKVKPGPERSIHIITLEREPGPEEVRELGGERVGPRTVVAISRSCSACRLMSQLDVYVVGDKPLDEERIDYYVIAPSKGKLRSAMAKLGEAGLSPRLISEEELKELGLTARQLEFLLLAYREGLFCVKRKITLSELAGELGVKPGSLVDVARRALKKVVEYYLRQEGLIPPDAAIDVCEV